MEGVEAAQKSGSISQSDGYGDIDDEEEAAEIERERLLDVFVEELAEEIVSSGIPDDQQHVLAKVLTRQHSLMLDHLRMGMEEGAEGEDWG